MKGKLVLLLMLVCSYGQIAQSCWIIYPDDEEMTAQEIAHPGEICATCGKKR